MKNIKHILVLSCVAMAGLSSQASDRISAQLSSLTNKQTLSEKSSLSSRLNENAYPENKTEFIIHPLSFIVSGFEVGVEIPAGEKRAFRGSAGYFLSNTANAYNDMGNSWNSTTRREFETMEGFRADVQYRFYSRPLQSVDNFYFAVFGVFKTATLTGTEINSIGPINTIEPKTWNSSAISAGILMGYKIWVHEMFSFDFNLGGGITPTEINDADVVHINQVNPYRKSINVRAGATFGIRI
jgi:hypothetical protein